MPATSKDIAALLDTLSETNPDAVVLDGFTPCILGIAERSGLPGPVLAYDYEACVRVLMERDGMDRDGAIEFLEFNVLGTWTGEGTPIFVTLV